MRPAACGKQRLARFMPRHILTTRGEPGVRNAWIEVALINRAGRPRRLPASWVETLQR